MNLRARSYCPGWLSCLLTSVTLTLAGCGVADTGVATATQAGMAAAQAQQAEQQLQQVQLRLDDAQEAAARVRREAETAAE